MADTKGNDTRHNANDSRVVVVTQRAVRPTPTQFLLFRSRWPRAQSVVAVRRANTTCGPQLHHAQHSDLDVAASRCSVGVQRQSRPAGKARQSSRRCLWFELTEGPVISCSDNSLWPFICTAAVQTNPGPSGTLSPWAIAILTHWSGLQGIEGRPDSYPTDETTQAAVALAFLSGKMNCIHLGCYPHSEFKTKKKKKRRSGPG